MDDHGVGVDRMNMQRIKEELLSFIDVLSQDQLQRLVNLVRNENWEAMSNRIHPRKALRPAGDCDETLNAPFAIKNISLGGAFIETDRALAMGQTITLEMSFENCDEALIIPGKVVRANAFGFGIQFVFDDEKAMQTLNQKLCQSTSG